MEADAGRLKHRNAFNLAAVNFTPVELAAEIRKDAPFASACYVGCGVTTGVGAVVTAWMYGKWGGERAWAYSAGLSGAVMVIAVIGSNGRLP